eukprot:1721167-Rhodomonas_salina.2
MDGRAGGCSRGRGLQPPRAEARRGRPIHSNHHADTAALTSSALSSAVVKTVSDERALRAGEVERDARHGEGQLSFARAGC